MKTNKETFVMLNTQNRSQAQWILAGGGIVLFALAMAALMFLSYSSANNYGSRTEASLEASKEDVRNVHSQTFQTIRGVAQVADRYAKDLERVTTAAIEGRYGDGGSQAVMQFLQEHNPTLGPEVHTTVSQAITSGYKNLEVANRRMTDIRRQYKGELGTTIRGYWLKQAGYPKVELSDFDVVVTGHTKQAFDTKEDAAIQVWD